MTNLKSQIINAVATALLLGAGTTVVGLKVSDARQDDRIASLQALHGDVVGLRSDLNRVDRHLSEIDGRMEADGPRH